MYLLSYCWARVKVPDPDPCWLYNVEGLVSQTLVEGFSSWGRVFVPDLGSPALVQGPLSWYRAHGISGFLILIKCPWYCLHVPGSDLRYLALFEGSLALIEGLKPWLRVSDPYQESLALPGGGFRALDPCPLLQTHGLGWGSLPLAEGPWPVHNWKWSMGPSRVAILFASTLSTLNSITTQWENYLFNTFLLCHMVPSFIFI